MNAAEIEMQETLRLLDEAVSEMRRLRVRAAAADNLAKALWGIEYMLDAERGGEPFLRGQAITMAREALAAYVVAKETT